jgi:ATP-binding cassette subfamily C protein CydCD
LLLRFFDPDSGSILIGGRDIRQLSLKGLRSLVSVVSQNTILFHGTIADNLRLAKPEATDAELHEAAQAAHIAAFIEALPEGYDTQIGERGASLSGGQRQRLAIARALLKDTPILLLDEATSNVDPASERAIQAAIDEIAGQRTVIVIAHRLSTVARADRVLVFEAGQIVEQGAPIDLQRDAGTYARLISAEGEAA